MLRFPYFFHKSDTAVSPQRSNLSGSQTPAGISLPETGTSYSYPTESLEVRDENDRSYDSATAPEQYGIRSVPFSRRKATIVSLGIVAAVTLLTAVTAAYQIRRTPVSTSTTLNNTVPAQTLELNSNQANILAPELQGSAQAMLVDGDIFARGSFKLSVDSFTGGLSASSLSANQTYNLPDSSGTICLDSNNCKFVTQAQLNTLQQLIPLQGGTAVQSITAGSANMRITRNGNAVTITDTTASEPKVSSLNAQTGALLLQGTPNQITVSSAGGTFTLSTPQDINTGASPAFAGLLLSGLNCTTNSNGGSLTTNGSGQLVCSDDESASGSITTAGGTSGTIPVFTGAQTVADSVITQSGTTVNVGGTLTLSNALGVGSGGTGTTTFTSNGVIYGNAGGAMLATAAPLAGQVLLGNAGGVPTFTTMSGDVAMTGAGLTTIQSNSVALGVDTTGNYVETVTAGNGISVTGGSGEGSTNSISVIYGSIANSVVEGNTTLTCPSGMGNLSGGGTVVTLGAGGACADLTIVNSPTFSGILNVQGATINIGTATQQGSLVLNDGTNHTGTIRLDDLAQDTIFTIPDPGSVSASFCLNIGNCIGGLGGASNSSFFLTVGNDAVLSDERAITTGTNLTATDGGANGAYTISTVANPSFTTSVTTPQLILSGAGSNGTVAVANLAAPRMFTLPDYSSGTGTICLDSGNCAGAGTGMTGSGTPGTLAKFDASQNIVGSLITESGTTITVSGTLVAADFQGDGSGITNINASNIATGTLADARLSANVSLLGASIQDSEVDNNLTISSSGSVDDGALSANVSLLGATIGLAELEADSVNSAKIVDGSVANIDLANASLTVTSGNGLVNGGSVALGGSTTLNIGAGDGITVNVDDVAVDATVCRTTGNCLGGASGGANTALSNLSSVAINTSLLTGAATIDLGSGAAPFRDLYLGGTATTNIRITGTSAAARVYTLPDVGANANFCLSTGNCAGAGGGITGSGTNGTLAKFTGTGTIGNSLITESGTALTVGGSVAATSFSGDGSALTSLNATNISSGTLADARLSANVTLQGNTFNGPSQLVQLNASTQLPAVSGALLTNLNASSIATGTLADARLSANVSLLGQTISNAELVNSSLTVTAGTGLSGGGSVALGASTTLNLADTAVTLGTYGNATNVAQFTVDQQGRITSAANVAITGLNSCSNCATRALDNLASVNINTSLLTSSNNTIDLGASANAFRSGYFGTSLVTPQITTASGDLMIDPTANTVIKGSTSATGTAALDVQNSTGSVLYVRNDGNVGIGTAMPTSKLEISGGSLTIPATSLSATQGLIIKEGATNVANLQGMDLGGISYAFLSTNRTYGVGNWSSAGWHGSRPAGSLQLNDDVLNYYQFAGGSNTPTEVFRIGSGGNVGIGSAAPTEKLHVSNGSGLIEYGNLKFTNVAAPAAPTVAINAAAGNLTGNYQYAVTFVTSQGETALGTASAVVAPSAQQVNLSAVPTGTAGVVTSRKIYRTLAGGTAYYLIATLANNTATTYTDNTADGSLTVVANAANTTGGRTFMNGIQTSHYDNYSANSASGYGALSANTSGSINTANGYYALGLNTTGIYNTATGGLALYSNTGGHFNVANGMQALFLNTTGSQNLAGGYASLYNNTIGSNNLAMGHVALYNNKTGSGNTAVGIQAGQGAANNSDITGNSLFGFAAGTALATGGNFNTMLGYGSGLAVTTGTNNTFIGVNSGANVTTGANNIIIGQNTNAASATANNQLNIGNAITGSLATGNINVLGDLKVGGSLTEKSVTFTPTTVGWYRIASGLNKMGGTVRINTDNQYDGTYTDVELQYNISGYAVGGSIQQTRYSSYNWGVVSQARISSDGGGNVYLDIYVSSATAPQPITVHGFGREQSAFVASPVVGAVAGSSDVNILTLGHGFRSTKGANFAETSGGVGIGVTSPNTALDIQGAFSMRSTTLPAVSPATQGRIYFDGSNFKVSENGGAYGTLLTSANAFVQNGNAFGTTAVLGTTDANDLIFRTGSGTNAATERLRVEVGGDVGIGTNNPGYKLDVAGDINTSGYYRQNGSIVVSTNLSASNAFIGISAGNTTTTGIFNTAVGQFVLQANTSGALNTASGSNALAYNTTGNFNTANGVAALENNTTGSGNTALGNGAGKTSVTANQNTTGSFNTFLGYNAGPGSTTQLQNATAIGTYAVVNQDNSLVLGCISGVNGCTTSTSVGIGTAAPARPLHVYGNDSTALSKLLIEQDGTGDASLAFLLTGEHNFALGIDNSDNNTFKISGTEDFSSLNHFNITTGGQVGIGTDSPNSPLHVVGGLCVESFDSGCAVGSGNIIAGGSLFVQGGTLDLGRVANTTGEILFRNISTGNTVTIQSGATTSGYTLTLPTTGPAVSQCLQSGATTASQLVFGSCSGGPWTQTGSNVHLTTSTNFVGIGTATPKTKLDLQGIFTVGGFANPSQFSDAGEGRIYFDSITKKFKISEDGSPWVDLSQASGALSLQGAYLNSGSPATITSTTSSKTIIFKTGAAGYESASFFQVQNNTGNTILDVDTANGRVGVGTTAPVAKLEVKGTGLFTGGLITTEMPAPGAPTVTPNAGNGTTWSYVITAFSDTGQTLGSPAGTTNNGWTALNGALWNDISWSAVPGATYYNVYRTVSAAGYGNGLVASLVATSYRDDGSATVNTTLAPPTSNSSGNVGIGTSTPNYRLSVAGVTNIASDGLFGNGTLRIGNGGVSNGALTISGNSTGLATFDNASPSGTAGIDFQTMGTSRLHIKSANGFVGIDNDNPGYRLHVGRAALPSGTEVARFENAGGTCTVLPNTPGGVTCTSDARLKKDVVSHEDSLSKIMGLQAVQYHLLAESDADPLHTGFIAQDMEALFPDLVTTHGDGYKSVSYAGLTPYLAQAIQQQQVVLDKLRGGTVQSLNVAEDASVGGVLSTKDLKVTGVATIGTLTVTEAKAATLAVTGVATIQTLKVMGQAEFASDLKLAGTAGNSRNAITKRFKATKAIMAGSVVVADSDNDGQVTTTSVKADRKVIGIAATSAPAGGEIEVAIGGTLQVKFDAGISAAGDLIISSDQEGAATVAPEDAKIGTVLGKATSKKDASGMVWILVTLQ